MEASFWRRGPERLSTLSKIPPQEDDEAMTRASFHSQEQRAWLHTYALLSSLSPLLHSLEPKSRNGGAPIGGPYPPTSKDLMTDVPTDQYNPRQSLRETHVFPGGSKLLS